METGRSEIDNSWHVGITTNVMYLYSTDDLYGMVSDRFVLR